MSSDFWEIFVHKKPNCIFLWLQVNGERSHMLKIAVLNLENFSGDRKEK